MLLVQVQQKIESVAHVEGHLNLDETLLSLELGFQWIFVFFFFFEFLAQYFPSYKCVSSTSYFDTMGYMINCSTILLRKLFDYSSYHKPIQKRRCNFNHKMSEITK